MLFALALLIPFIGTQKKVDAATLGQQLTAPEAGWTRYDDLNPGFKYNGTWRVDSASSTSTTKPFLNAEHWVFSGDTNGLNTSIDFEFVGKSLRIVTSINNVDSSNIVVTIDGNNYSYNAKSSSSTAVYQILVFEKNDLAFGLHTVHVQPTISGQWGWDAIDIDNTGYLVSSNVEAPLDLQAAVENDSVVLNWSSVTGASGYNIKRSTSSGGPYSTIASGVTGTTYTDNGLTYGTTYYYVVTAVNASGESVSSNEASGTPIAPAPSGRAILTLHLSDGNEKEYDLSANELTNFLDWTETATQSSKYKFVKTWNKGPFKARAEYIVYGKIVNFDVDEYEPEQ